MSLDNENLFEKSDYPEKAKPEMDKYGDWVTHANTENKAKEDEISTLDEETTLSNEELMNITADVTSEINNSIDEDIFSSDFNFTSSGIEEKTKIEDPFLASTIENTPNINLENTDIPDISTDDFTLPENIQQVDDLKNITPEEVVQEGIVDSFDEEVDSLINTQSEDTTEIDIDSFLDDFNASDPNTAQPQDINFNKTEEVDLDSFISEGSFDSNSEQEVNLDEFLDVDSFMGGGESINIDEFVTQETKPKEEIIDQEIINMDLIFDDTFAMETMADPVNDVEISIDTSSFGEGESFDDLFDNIQDENLTGNIASSLVNATSSENSTSFDEVTEFDDLLDSLSDEPQSNTEIKQETKSVKTIQDYNITVTMDTDTNDTEIEEEIVDDENEVDDVPLFDSNDKRDLYKELDKNQDSPYTKMKITEAASNMEFDELDDLIMNAENTDNNQDDKQKDYLYTDDAAFTESIDKSSEIESIDDFTNESLIIDDISKDENVTDSFISEDEITEDINTDMTIDKTTDDTISFDDLDSTKSINNTTPVEPTFDDLDTMAFDKMDDKSIGEPTFDDLDSMIVDNAENQNDTLDNMELTTDDTFPTTEEITETSFDDLDLTTDDSIPATEDTTEASFDDLDLTADDSIPTTEDTAEASFDDLDLTADDSIPTTEDTTEASFDDLDLTADDSIPTTEDTAEVSFDDLDLTTDDSTPTTEDTAEVSFDDLDLTTDDSTPTTEDTAEASFDDLDLTADNSIPTTEDTTEASFNDLDLSINDTTNKLDTEDSYNEIENISSDEFLDKTNEFIDEDLQENQSEIPSMIDDELLNENNTEISQEDKDFFNSDIDFADDVPETLPDDAFQKKVEDEMDQATMPQNTINKDILENISKEISNLRNELASLKEEFNNIKAPANIVQEKEAPATGFFNDDEEDETIALSGDELNNIMISADFTEEFPTTQDDVELSAPIVAEETSPFMDSIGDIENIDDFDDTPLDENTEPTINIDDTSLEEPSAEDLELSMDLSANDDEKDSSLPTEIDIPKIDDIIVEPSSTDFMDSMNDPVQDENDDILESTDDQSFIPETETLEEDVDEVSDEPIESVFESDQWGEDATITDNSVIESQDSINIEQQETSLEDELAIPEEEIPEEEVPQEKETENTISSAIPQNLQGDIKSVLLYMDQLLENLPEDKIAEFAKSEHFDVYKKLFNELGLA